MGNINLIDQIQTAVAVIDRKMTIIDANHAFAQRSQQQRSDVIGKKCYAVAYHFNEPCKHKVCQPCPLEQSFKTKQKSSHAHHFWIDKKAVVEEITTTPIIEKDGSVKYVIEEFRDISGLLGLNNGIITTCAYCKKIRDNDNKWHRFETYFQKHTGADFSHGICDKCQSEVLKYNCL